MAAAVFLLKHMAVICKLCKKNTHNASVCRPLHRTIFSRGCATLCTHQRYGCFQLPVRAVAFSPSGAYALSASEGERQVALWSLAAPSAATSSKKSRSSAGLLSLDEPAMQLATSPAVSTSDETSFQAMLLFFKQHCSLYSQCPMFVDVGSLLRNGSLWYAGGSGEHGRQGVCVVMQCSRG